MVVLDLAFPRLSAVFPWEDLFSSLRPEAYILTIADVHLRMHVQKHATSRSRTLNIVKAGFPSLQAGAELFYRDCHVALRMSACNSLCVCVCVLVTFVLVPRCPLKLEPQNLLKLFLAQVMWL